MSHPIISVKNVSFRYENIYALKNISFDIFAGEYVGIIGPNGGGKTTLIKLLLSLLPYESGSIELFGVPSSKFAERHFLGYVPQRVSSINFPASVRELIESGRSAACTGNHLCNTDAKKDIEEALECTNIKHLASKRIEDLSGGERQRVFIARALAGHPKILVLDEPTTGIDKESGEQFYALLKKLNKEQGLTILFVSHDIAMVSTFTSKILFINQTLTEYKDAKALHDAQFHNHHHA